MLELTTLAGQCLHQTSFRTNLSNVIRTGRAETMVTRAAQRDPDLVQLQPLKIGQGACLTELIVEHPLTHLAISLIDQPHADGASVVLIRQRGSSKSCFAGCHCFGPYEKPREAELPGASLQHIV